MVIISPCAEWSFPLMGSVSSPSSSSSPVSVLVSTGPEFNSCLMQSDQVPTSSQLDLQQNNSMITSSTSKSWPHQASNSDTEKLNSINGDVDLLSMPGLVSLASPIYDSYNLSALSPTDSIMTRISSSDSMNTTANSKIKSNSKSNFNIVNQFPQSLVSMDGKQLNTDKSSPDEATPASATVPPGVTTQVASSSITANHVEEDDNFAESQSLAGLWSNHDMIQCENDPIMGHESLVSILNSGLPSSMLSLENTDHVDNSCIGSEFIIDELDYLMSMPQGNHESSAHTRAPTISSSSAASNVINHVNPMVYHQYNAALPHHGSAASGGGNMSTSAQGSLNGVSSYGSLYSASPKIENGDMIGKKRPFSTLDQYPTSCVNNNNTSTNSIPGMASATTSMWLPSNGNMFGTTTTQMQEKQDIQNQEMTYTSATQAFSAMLYKAQGGSHSRLSWAGIGHNTNDMIKVPPAKARRRHGTAMDPQSIAARTRREKFSDRIRILQSLVPNGERLDTVSMLGQTLEYVRFLQHQVWQLYHGMDPTSNLKNEKWKDFIEASQPTQTQS